MKQCPVMRFVPPMIKDIRTAKNYCPNANGILNHMHTVCRNLETQMCFFTVLIVYGMSMKENLLLSRYLPK